MTIEIMMESQMKANLFFSEMPGQLIQHVPQRIMLDDCLLTKAGEARPDHKRFVSITKPKEVLLFKDAFHSYLAFAFFSFFCVSHLRFDCCTCSDTNFLPFHQKTIVKTLLIKKYKKYTLRSLKRLSDFLVFLSY